MASRKGPGYEVNASTLREPPRSFPARRHGLRSQTDYLVDFHVGQRSIRQQLLGRRHVAVFLDSLVALPRLDGIFWHPEPPRARLGPWVDTLQAIRRRGPVLEVMAADVDEACMVAAALGPDGLLVALPRFPSTTAAQAAIDAIETVCRRGYRTNE